MKRHDEQESMRMRAALVLSAVLVLGSGGVAFAQTFDSGVRVDPATGMAVDGALDLTGTPSGTTVFFKKDAPSDTNPSVEDRLGRALDWSDTRFDFTRIVIPANVTLRFSAAWTNGPIYFLVQDDPLVGQPPVRQPAVSIVGTLDLNGESGADRTLTTADRRPAIPGPGGYFGGVGGNIGSVPQVAHGGAGPAAGRGYNTAGWTDCCARGEGARAQPGTAFLVPLVGGSGGGGGSTSELGWWGGGGGGGGGAILIATSGTIDIATSGRIYAYGGSGGYGNSTTSCGSYFGGGGSAGAVRLAARTLSGAGRIEVGGGAGSKRGDCGDQYNGRGGRIRLEAFTHAWSYVIPYGTYATGSPLNSFVPTTPAPQVRVVSVGNGQVVSDPTGSFAVPDVTFSSSTPVQIVIQTSNLPAGSESTLVLTLVLLSLEGADQILTNSGATPGITPVDGQPGRYQATTTVPSGFSRGFVRASW